MSSSKKMTEAFLRFTVIIICCHFIVHVETSFFHDSALDESVAEYYKAYGVVKWIADVTSFCQLTTPIEPAASFNEAYFTIENIMLELANCTPIVMEVLHCLYRQTSVYGNAGAPLETFSVSAPNYQIFSVHIPGMASKCNAPNFWIIGEEIVVLGKSSHVSVEHQNLTQIPVVNVMDNAERILAAYYATNHGCIKWKWDPRAFCETLIPGGELSTSFRGAYVVVDKVMLERANCTVIEMEILYCDYAHHETSGYVDSRMKNFVNGLNEEIFEVRSPGWTSRCNAPSVWIIHHEVFEGSRLPRRD